MEWTREKTLRLIEEYQKRRGLWDMTHEDYRKKFVKRELLTEIAGELNVSLPTNEIEKKFHTLRTQYHREINRMKQSSEEEYKSKWFAYKHLEFLSSPKACRGSKLDIKVDRKAIIKKEINPPATYIIKQLKQEKVDKTHDEKIENQHSIPIQNSTIATEFITIPKKNIVLNEKENDSRKELEKLFHEATKETEDIENEFIQPAMKITTAPISSQQDYATQNIQTLENFIDDQDEISHEQNSTNQGISIAHSDNFVFHSSNNQTPYIKIQKKDNISKDRLFENHFEPKKIKFGNSENRDEFSIYGEYVANEMRMITVKEVLINLKHKINVALFEANMSQLNKERL